MKTDNIIKNLILDNLRAVKLVDGLAGLGLYSLEYYPTHYLEILSILLNRKFSEEQKDTLFIMAEKVDKNHIENHDGLQELSNEIFQYLKSASLIFQNNICQ